MGARKMEGNLLCKCSLATANASAFTAATRTTQKIILMRKQPVSHMADHLGSFSHAEYIFMFFSINKQFVIKPQNTGMLPAFTLS